MVNMGKSKPIRIDYLQVCANMRGNVDTPFDLREWIVIMDEKALKERTIDYRGEKARLEQIYTKAEGRYFCLNFLRMSDTDIPKKAKSGEMAEPVTLEEDEYIGKDVTALYDHEYSILALQYNKGSLSIGGIEEYINKYWENRNEHQIYLRPILPPDVAQRINENSAFRTLNIRFADMKNQPVHGETLGGVYGSLNSYSPFSADISLKAEPRKADSFLDRNKTRETVQEIYNNREAISKAEVQIKLNEDSEIEVLDLFEEKLHDRITVYVARRTVLGSEFLADKMIEKYNRRRASIAQLIRPRR